METKVKVYGRAQNRIALGIINAYLNINPNSTFNDLKKAFPDTINPDCGSRKIFMSEDDINAHIAKGEAWYASARGYFVEDDEWLIMLDGERVGFVSMWSKPSFDRLVTKAKEFGIEVVFSNERTGTYRLEYVNGPTTSNDGSGSIIENIKKTTDNIIETASSVVDGVTKFIGDKISTLKKDSSHIESDMINECADSEISTLEGNDMRTYHLCIESERFYRIDKLELPNASDEEIENGFDNNDSWTDIVGETQLLYTRTEDLFNAINDDDYSYFEDDEEGVKKITDMIGDCIVDTSSYYPNACEDFRIKILNEDNKVIDVVEGEDIPSVRFEEGYKYDPETAGDDNTYELMKKYFEKNNTEEGDRCNDFNILTEGWTWVNIQNCEPDEYPVYELQIKGDFDANKLSVKKVLLEETINGMSSIEAITRVLYDGEELKEYEGGSTLSEEGTNYFIKRESEELLFPIAIYDFTNKEKA